MADADDVRRLALALPHVEEIDSEGFDFRVGGKGFVWSYPERRAGEPRRIRTDVAVLYVGDEAEKQALLLGEPSRFFTTAGYDGWPLVLLRLTEVDVERLRELVTDAWRMRAPELVGASSSNSAGSGPMQFTATAQLNARTATGIPVPNEVVEQLGGGKRPKVRVRIGDYEFRSSVAPWGDGYMLPFSSEHRSATGLGAGDQVTVDLELDTEPRQVDVPPDFAAALDADRRARALFDGLSYSQQRWFTLSIDGAKTAETRQRRIDKYVAMLHEGRAR